MQPPSRPASARARINRLVTAIGLVALLGSLLPAAAALAAPGDIGFEGPSYAGASGEATGSKPESKLWFNDGIWWGSLWDEDTADFHIYRLDLAAQTWIDTGVRLDDRPGTRSDVLWDGTKLYVASHRFSSTNTSGYAARLYRFSYNAIGKTYTLDAGFPATIHNFRVETTVIDKDSTGTLWATWTQNSQVMVSHTNGSDSSWVTPFVLPGAGAVDPDDISSVVSFRRSGGPGQIGVVWSNQVDSKIYFGIHTDGDPDTTWDLSKVALQGPGVADDHVNLKSVQSDGSGRVYAAVKTSHSSGSAPLIMVLVFDPATGQWSSSVAGRVSDSHTRPIVVIDDEAQVAHVVMTGPQPPATSGQAGGTIYEKTAPLGTLAFATGVGTPIIRDADVPDMNDATSTKQNVNSTTGLVILAGNDTTDTYWWHFDALGGSPPSSDPPVAAFSATPTTGAAPLDVSFTDASTNLPTSWAWDFDDDGTVDSTAQNPVHTYTVPGTYTIRLTASNSAGSDDEVKTGYVTVGDPLTFASFAPTADAFVSSSSATKNYGTNTVLRVRNSSTIYRSYLSFTVTGLDGPVQSAKLRLFVTDASPDGGSVYPVASGWTENGITFANAPGLPGSPSGAVGATTPVGTWVEADLGAAITGNGTYSFAIASNSSNSAYYSSRQGTNPPQLVVGYDPGGSPPVAPVAAFSATPTSGGDPLSVAFTDESSNAPTSWAWDFDNDGTTDSTAQNPVFVYAAVGTYTVKLTASNAAGGDDEVKADYITVSDAPPPPPPVVDFSGTPTSGAAPLSVAFTDASSGTPTSWAWDFDNDGTVDSTLRNPTFIFTTPGTYSVKLTAGNAGGDGSLVKTDYITVSDAPPPPQTITVPVSADSRISQQFPTSNYGSDSTLRIRLDPAAAHRAYVRFAVSGIGGAVTSVKLRLFVTDASPAGGTVYPTSSAWTESTLNWNNAPAATGAAIRAIGATTLGTWVEVDVTGSVTANGTYDFLISDGNTNSAFYSSREGANPPELVITQTP
ncbi:MAG TPA: DNRLRE domain-containing protein [Candidatus Limnocylindrales bacterium]|nr:DNRLRE domain-containing protein [Candidatus Limnocylindrales bacterium]